jgi:hypothetical protein
MYQKDKPTKKFLTGRYYMLKLIELENNKTYATEENAIKAVEKYFGKDTDASLTYFIYRDENYRYFPVFVGHDAIEAGVHFVFNVIG